ncbi:MAG TPA: response regulator [Bryobacteraceae bacterium]|nr:response regulator [Bryobacteraceae bacterium]
MGGSGWNPNPPTAPPSTSQSRSEEKTGAVLRRVLIIEDNEADVFLIQRVLEATELPLAFSFVHDGQEAIRFFDEADNSPERPCPELVILDINLPKKQGGDVLKHMRNTSRCAMAHVIAVSTSDSPRDREQMSQLGADAYFHKPSEFDEFMKLADLVKSILD